MRLIRARWSGLLISPKRLVEIRSSRLVTMGQSMKNSYADYEKVEDEIAFCRSITVSIRDG
jgi:[pyruvate, water dikinase]-phosphate phosphotransferase / [pyruvate, water dikinase] kinase